MYGTYLCLDWNYWTASKRGLRENKIRGSHQNNMLGFWLLSYFLTHRMVPNRSNKRERGIPTKRTWLENTFWRPVQRMTPNNSSESESPINPGRTESSIRILRKFAKRFGPMVTMQCRHGQNKNTPKFVFAQRKYKCEKQLYCENCKVYYRLVTLYWLFPI